MPLGAPHFARPVHPAFHKLSLITLRDSTTPALVVYLRPTTTVLKISVTMLLTSTFPLAAVGQQKRSKSKTGVEILIAIRICRCDHLAPLGLFCKLAKKICRRQTSRTTASGEVHGDRTPADCLQLDTTASKCGPCARRSKFAPCDEQSVRAKSAALYSPQRLS